MLSCGPHEIYSSDWETAMVCDLVCEERVKTANGEIPKTLLPDGREAFVVTIGTPDSIMTTKLTAVHRSLTKGDTYG